MCINLLEDADEIDQYNTVKIQVAFSKHLGVWIDTEHN